MSNTYNTDKISSFVRDDVSDLISFKVFLIYLIVISLNQDDLINNLQN